MTSAETLRLQHEAELARRQLSTDLDSLQGRLSPSGLMEHGMGYLKDGDVAAFGRNLSRQMRDNPVPVAITAVGLAWLMLGRGTANGRYHAGAVAGNGARMPYASAAHDSPATTESRFGTATRVMGSAAQAVGSAAQSVGSAIGSVRDRVAAAGAAVAQKAGETADAFQARLADTRGQAVGLKRNAEESLASFAERIERAMSETGSSISATGHDLADASRAGMHDLRDRAGAMRGMVGDAGHHVVTTLREQPLLAGTLGVAVGMAVAMLLPASRVEQRVADDLRDRVGDQVGVTVRGVQESATRVVEAMARSGVETATGEIKRQTGEAPSQESPASAPAAGHRPA